MQVSNDWGFYEADATENVCLIAVCCFSQSSSRDIKVTSFDKNMNSNLFIHKLISSAGYSVTILFLYVEHIRLK